MKDEIKEILDKPKILMLSYGNYISLDDYVKLKDYITNLQEDLDYQRQAEQEYNEKYTKLMKKYKELQERKNKAIKYLEQPYRDNFDYSKAELLNILQGEDKDEK